jgi:thioredoxin reductase
MEQRDVVIIGGGPAGLSAARRLADLGLRNVTVLEREQEAGGIPRHCGHTGFGWQSHHRIWTGPRFAAELRRSVEGLDVRAGTTALSIESGHIIRIQSKSGLAALQARRILVATGTRETPRAVRLIGGSRPQGVMNTGALQAHVYLRQYRPFERPVIIGSEWVSFSAILTCRHLGIRPVALIEENRRIAAPRPGDLIARLVYSVPVWTRTKLIAIEGKSQVEAVEIEQDGVRRHVACDGVILTGQFVPEATLLVNQPDVSLAGNVQGQLKTSGVCWREGRAAADTIAQELK